MADVVQLTARAFLRVTGPEAKPFLNGLLTQEVETLADGELRYGALLTSQGRLVCDLFLKGEPEGVLIDVDASVRDALAAKLKLHRLRAKCEIAPADETVAAAWGEAPTGERWTIDPRLPAAGWRGYGISTIFTADADAYEAYRFALGLPDSVRDGLADKAYATEANLDLLHGVDFHKGCYVGQETTSRMWRRGGIRSRVLPLAVKDARPGDEVLADGELRAGVVTGARSDRALALLRLDRVLDRSLTVQGRFAELQAPAWLPPDALVPPTQEMLA